MSEIITLDNKVTHYEMSQIYNYVIESKFKIGFADNNEIENQSTVYLNSNYTMDEYIYGTGLPDIIGRTPELKTRLDGYKASRQTVNLSTPTEHHHPHVHSNTQKIFLYYVNLQWDISWEGETLFYNQDLSEIIQTSMFVPGRMVLFDGDIPHTLRAQTTHAPMFRFTIATFYDRIE